MSKEMSAPYNTSPGYAPQYSIISRVLATLLLIVMALVACGEDANAPRPAATSTPDHSGQPDATNVSQPKATPTSDGSDHPASFTQVSAGRYFTCGVKTDSSLACWGDIQSGVEHAVNNYWKYRSFTSIAVGHHFACGITTQGAIECAGDYLAPDEDQNSVPPKGTYVSVSAADSYACAVTTDGSVICWGLAQHGQTSLPFAKSITSKQSPYAPYCGEYRDDDGDIRAACWSSANGDEERLPDREYVSIESGNQLACALNTDNTVVCWGYELAAIPAEPFTSISVGGSGQSKICGLRADGTIACWGYWHYEDQPPSGVFTEVSLGSNGALSSSACGLQADGTVVCWDGGDGSAPSGKFKSISVGWGYACAVRIEGTIACWGDNEYGQASPPDPGQSRLN